MLSKCKGVDAISVDGCVLSSAQIDNWVALAMTGDGLVLVVTEHGLVLVVVETLVGDSLVLDAGCASTSEDELPSE